MLESWNCKGSVRVEEITEFTFKLLTGAYAKRRNYRNKPSRIRIIQLSRDDYILLCNM